MKPYNEDTTIVFRPANWLMKILIVCSCMVFNIHASATTYYWVYNGTQANSNWSNGNNWSTTSGNVASPTGAAPTVSVDVVFDNHSGNCTINAAATCNSITLNNTFTNTITQSAALSVTGTTGGLAGTGTFSGGTFSGGNSSITIVGAFTISGTNFTSTSGTLTLGSSFTISSGSFTHNSGTVNFNNFPLACNYSVTGTVTFSNLTITGYFGTFTANNSFTVSGNLILDATNGANTLAIGTSAGIAITVNGNVTMQGSGIILINTGTLNVNGNFTDNNTEPNISYGTGTIAFTGSGTQTLTGPSTAGQGELPNVVINCTGTVSLSGIISIGDSWTYTAGTLNAGTSTLYLDNTTNSITVSGTQTLYNVTINPSYSTTTFNNTIIIGNNFTINGTLTCTVAISSSVTVNGTLAINGTYGVSINTGTLYAKGNVTITNTYSTATNGGTGTVVIAGSGSQTISNSSGAAGSGCLPNVTVASTGGTVSLSGIISTANWLYTSGTVSAGTSTVVLWGPLSSYTLTSAGMSFYNISMGAQIVTLASALTATNNLTILATGNTNNLTTSASNYGITVGGNWTCNATFTPNNSTVTLNGSGAQTFSKVAAGGTFRATTYQCPIYNLTITNTSVTTLASNISITNNLSLSGTSTFASSNFTINGNAVGTLTLNAGTTLILGTPGSATIVAFPSNYTTANTTLASTSTVIYQSNGTTNQAISTIPTSYGNLYLYSGNGASIKTYATATLTITGNLRIGDTTSAGTTLNALTKNINVTGNVTINSDGNMPFTSGSGTLSVGGNFLLNGTCTIATTTTFKGNFTNNGTFSQATSSCTFSGTVQTISGSTNTTFYNLTENGGTSGSLTVSQAQVTVSNTLNLTKDNIIVSTGDLLVLPTTVSPTGGSAASFVDGNMQAAIATSATYEFPSGNETVWEPIAVVGVSSPSVFQAQYFYTAPANPTAIVADLDHISQLEYWVLNEVSGGTANVKLYSENPISASGGIYDCPDLAVAHYTGGNWVDADPTAQGTGAGCSAPHTGLVTITTNTPLSSFSPFTFGSRVPGWGNNPLPVQLLYLTANCNNYYANIQWQTATETNNAFFTLERTSDGINYETVGSVKGAGSSLASHTYNIIDYSPLNGIAYYKLSQTNNDGSTTILNTTVFEPCEQENSAVTAFYGNNAVNIQVQSSVAGQYAILLTDDLGRIVYQQTKNVVPGLNIFKIDPSHSSSVYLLKVTGNNTAFTKKLLLGTN